MQKKKIFVFILVIFFFLLGGCDKSEMERDSTSTIEEDPTIQTNFYQAINKEWLNATWTSSSPFYNEFTRLQIEIDELLKNDFEQMVTDSSDLHTEDQIEFIKLYKQGFDFVKRGEAGVSSMQPILAEMAAIHSFSELEYISKDWILKDYSLPYGVEVIPNPQNTSEFMLMLTAPKTILPDKSYYQDANKKTQLLDLYRSSVIDLMIRFGYKEEEAQQLASQAIAFDALLVPLVSVNEEISSGWGPSNEDNIRSFSEVKAYSAIMSLDKTLPALIGSQPVALYVSDVTYFQQLDTILQEENFSDYRAWALVNQMIKLSPYLTGEMMQISSRLSAELKGETVALPNEYQTYLDVTGLFKETVSHYYGQKYADETAIKDVLEMTRAIVKTYKERILANDWLSLPTKQSAVKKLDKIRYFIGYPRDVSGRTKSIKVDDSLSYVENILAIKAEDRKASFDSYGAATERESWTSFISSSDVVAAYSPYQNAIYIPSAILQAPFYDKTQSLSENYGGIGKIIAHEIAHAFDSIGSKFDETGSLKNWWLDQDKELFEERTEAVLELFDGLEIYGGKVNGQSTLTENIADLGGVQIALETLKNIDKTADLRTFFEHYAMSRREQVSLAYGEYMLTVDPHAPEEFRVNIQLQQLDDFYEVYDIKAEDPMYRAPEDRIRIW